MTRRRMWDEVLPAWRHAHRATQTAQLGPATRAVLEAVIYLLAAHQRTSDHVRLAQIAEESGIWDGHGECPRSAAAAAGRHLQRLADVDAIGYEPNRSRSVGCRIWLLTDDTTRAHGTRDTATPETAETRAPHARHQEPSRAPGESETRANGARDARQTPPSRARGARAPEGFPEDVVRGERPEGERATQNNTAGRPAPQAPPPPFTFTFDELAEPLWKSLNDCFDENPNELYDHVPPVYRHLLTNLTEREQRDRLADELMDRPPKTAHGAIRRARELLDIDIPHLPRPKEPPA